MPSLTPSPTPDASATRRGLMGVGAQVFAGMKTFLDAIKLSKKASGALPAGGAELEGCILYNTTTKRLMYHNGTQWSTILVNPEGGTPISLEEHIASTSNAHSAEAISMGYSNPWVDGTLNGEGALSSRINKIINDLTDSAGSAKIGATPWGSMAGNNVQSQLRELDNRSLAACAWGGHDVDMNGDRNYNGSISRSSTGVYVVTFPNLPDVNNNRPVHVTVNENIPRVPVYAWEGAGNTVTVRIFNLAGAPVDAFFSVSIPRV